MAVNVRITGIKEVNRFFLELPKKMDSEIMNASNEFAVFVQKSAKLRAPRDTGYLAKSIKVVMGKKSVKIVVDSPYGIFQEQGYIPHWVHTGMSNRRDGTIGSSLSTKKKGFIFVSKFTPFITPALEMGLNRLPFLLNMAVEKATIKSK